MLTKVCYIQIKFNSDENEYYISEYKNNQNTMIIKLTKEKDEAYLFPVEYMSEYGTSWSDGYKNCKLQLTINNAVEYIIVNTINNILNKETKRKYAHKTFDEFLGVKHIVPFGKYKGQTIQEVYQTDKNYLDWLMSKDDVWCRANIKEVFNKNELYNKRVDFVFGDKTKGEKKREIEEDVRSIIKKTKKYVNKEDTEFLFKEVFYFHPHFEQKIGDFSRIKNITVDLDEYGKNKCFYINYIDGRCDDISWTKCLKNRFTNHFNTL